MDVGKESQLKGGGKDKGLNIPSPSSLGRLSVVVDDNDRALGEDCWYIAGNRIKCVITKAWA